MAAMTALLRRERTRTPWVCLAAVGTAAVGVLLLISFLDEPYRSGPIQVDGRAIRDARDHVVLPAPAAARPPYCRAA